MVPLGFTGADKFHRSQFDRGISDKGCLFTTQNESSMFTLVNTLMLQSTIFNNNALKQVGCSKFGISICSINLFHHFAGWAIGALPGDEPGKVGTDGATFFEDWL